MLCTPLTQKGELTRSNSEEWNILPWLLPVTEKERISLSLPRGPSQQIPRGSNLSYVYALHSAVNGKDLETRKRLLQKLTLTCLYLFLIFTPEIISKHLRMSQMYLLFTISQYFFLLLISQIIISKLVNQKFI